MSSDSDKPGGIDREGFAHAETHPLRASILELLAMDAGRTLAPNEMAYELQSRFATVNHHATELRKSRLIRLVYEHEVRGQIEHFYCLPDRSAADLFERLGLPHDPA